MFGRYMRTIWLKEHILLIVTILAITYHILRTHVHRYFSNFFRRWENRRVNDLHNDVYFENWIAIAFHDQMNLAIPSKGASIGKNMAMTVNRYCMICLVPTKDLNKLKDSVVTLPNPIHEIIVDIMREIILANKPGRLTIAFLAIVFMRLRKLLRL
jgi:hypothetical protein